MMKQRHHIISVITTAVVVQSPGDRCSAQPTAVPLPLLPPPPPPLALDPRSSWGATR